MRFALRTNVGTRLAIAVFFAILFSWVLSAGTSSYISYQRIHALRQQMLSHPELYPYPIPEPEFGIMDFLLGPKPSLWRPGDHAPRFGRDQRPLPPPNPQAANRPAYAPGRVGVNPQINVLPGAADPRPGPPEGRHWGRPDPRMLLAIHTITALLLAIIVGKWLGGGFSKKLLQLSEGATAFNEGNFQHRINEGGEDEFAQVSAAMNSMAARVSEQVKSLEDDARRRRQMLADVAHELRSPVATIRMMAGALEDGVASDPERHNRAISSMVRSSDRLLHLVTDLLELARLDLNELPIHPKPSDLRGLAASAVESHTTAAAQFKVTIHPVEPGLPVMATVDPMRLSQVLDNLLNNAISYAGEGAEVRVTVSNGESAKITVSDNGRGISEDHMPYVFDPFYRADSARTPDANNHSGLGLRISRALIEAHNGRLTLTSQENRGTTATITLPVIRPATPSTQY